MLIVRDETIFMEKGERATSVNAGFISKCIHDRMKAMAPHVSYLHSIYLSEPSF